MHQIVVLIFIGFGLGNIFGNFNLVGLLLDCNSILFCIDVGLRLGNGVLTLGPKEGAGPKSGGEKPKSGQTPTKITILFSDYL
jgi:hypothetical protein